jgi:hypothetical protein
MNIIKGAKIKLFDNVTVNNLTLGHYLSNLKINKQCRFHAYCVGLPRSGTHSIAKMFEDNYRSAHEPYHSSAIKVLEKGSLRDNEFINKYLVTKDTLLNLEIESSQYLYRFTPNLVTLFPDANFILTVREPKSWLESEFNKLLRSYKNRPNNIWRRYDEIKYGAFDFSFESEKIQNTSNSYPVRQLLSYYKKNIVTVLNSVPKHKLLVVDTFEINSNINTISEFLSTGGLCRTPIISGFDG